MMLKYCFKWLCFLVFSVVVNVHAAQITVHFSLPFADSCTLVTHQNFIDELEPKQTKPIIENQCKFNIEYSKPVIATLYYNKQQVSFMLLQDQAIEIYIGTDSLYKSVRLTGDDAHNSNLVLNFNKTFYYDYQDSTTFVQMLAFGADAYEMMSYKQQQIQMEFVRKHADTLKYDGRVLDYLRNRIKYNYYYKVQSFAIINANANKGLTVKPIPEILLDKIDVSLVNDSLLNIDTYRKFIEYLVIYQTSKLNSFNKFTDFNISMDKKVAFAATRLSGQTKSYYIAYYLYNHLNEVLPATIKYNYQLLKNNDALGYANLLAANCEKRMQAKVSNNDAPIGNKPKQIMGIDGKYFTLQDFKGKVVYVDFWASWCGPCKQQFPYAKELHKRFTDKQLKHLKFLYVSIDKTTEIWKSAIEQNGLQDFIHGFAPGDWNSDLIRFYKISSIPRYMIIDKKGEIRFLDAKRPNDASVYDTLIELLAE